MPLVALLFDAALLQRPALLAGAAASPARIGFAAVGTLFAAMLVRARSRDVLLPVLLYPITIPVIIAGVRGTAALRAAGAGRADGDLLADAADCFDTVFVTLALWTFDPLMTD